MYQFRLIGYPIQHSLSPWIHEKFLAKANLTGDYKIHEIPTEDSFVNHVTKLRAENISGYNITVPYKQTIIPYLDSLDPEAKRIGAVNTVVNNNGLWTGYNTDGSGYVRSLENKFPHIVNEKATIRILLLGAGGAARGIYDALVQQQYRAIDIANRTIQAAEEIARLQTAQTKTTIKTLAEAENELATYDIVIQTTSVGMRPHIGTTIISLDQLNQNTIVSDIVYQPIETKFLQEAKKYGAQIHHGHTMLLYQAQYAFELWTGQKISVQEMDQALKNILEGE